MTKNLDDTIEKLESLKSDILTKILNEDSNLALLGYLSKVVTLQIEIRKLKSNITSEL